MEITLDALLKGKPTIIKDNKYLSTKEYVQPFIDEMSKYTKNFIIHVQLPNQVTLSENNKDLTYNKVWIQAIWPSQVEGYNETYGLVYALDTKSPVYKVYRAFIDMKTHNLCVFDPSWLIAKSLKPETLLSYDIQGLIDKPSDMARRLKTMKNSFISPEIEDTHEMLGKLINKSLLYQYKNAGGKTKLASSDIVKAFTDVYYTKTSNFYVPSTIEGSLHNYYSSVCNQITKSKDIINRFEKTLLVGMLFDLVKNEDDNKA